MEIHHATTPRNNTIAITDMRRRRENQMAQIVNAAKITAKRQTHPGPWQIRIVDGQRGPRDRYGPAEKDDDRDQPAERPDRKLRSELIGFSRCFNLPNAYRRRRSQGKRYASFRGRRDSRGNVYRPDFTC